jgi:hypothetical protein
MRHLRPCVIAGIVFGGTWPSEAAPITNYEDTDYNESIHRSVNNPDEERRQTSPQRSHHGAFCRLARSECGFDGHAG